MRATVRHRSRWVETEDTDLMTMVKVQEREGKPRDWNAIAAQISGRSNKDCRKRWLKLKGSKRAGEWDANEDERLREAVEEHGFKWVQVENYVRTRSADQCASRWQNHLDPNLNRNEWLQDEDIRLLNAYETYGTNWKMIQLFALSDRSLQDIRNRYRCLGKVQRVDEALLFNHTMFEFDAMSSLVSESPPIFGLPDMQYVDERGSNATISPMQTQSDSSSSDNTLCDNSDTGTNGAWKDNCGFIWQQGNAELGYETTPNEYYQIPSVSSLNSPTTTPGVREIGDADVLKIIITLDGADMSVLDTLVKVLNVKNTRFTITINNQETRSNI